MKNLVWTILILAVFSTACGDGVFSVGDERAEAGDLVAKANENLKKIGKIHKANSKKLEDLKDAIRERDTAGTQQILGELIKAIEDGLKLGEMARNNVKDASQKKTDKVFAEYLSLKERALRYQIDAYEYRLKVARNWYEKFGTNNPEEIERAKAEFAENQENFQKLWDAGEDLNERADSLARENPSKIRLK